MLPARSASLREARTLLMQNGEAPEGLLGPVVARSWKRSLDAGLSPVGRLLDAPHLDSFQIARVAAGRQEFVANARPVMEYLHGQMKDSGSMVILASDRGVVLQTMGDADFLDRAGRVALMPGASWSESHRGTNAIGTALAEASPVVVHGAEHFLERNGFLTCAAAPVMSPDGRLLGVLDISGDQVAGHPHTFCLVRAAAQMIENRLFEARHGNALKIRFHPLAEGIGTVAEGVAALSEDGWIVGANREGLSLLGLLPADLGVTPLSRLIEMNPGDLFDWGRRRAGEIMPFRLRSGRRLFVKMEGSVSRKVVHSPVQIRDALAALESGDPVLKSVLDKARRVAGKEVSLLLLGESGVGKDLFARAVHDSGTRRSGPFVALNCATLPENLIESELFGHAPGAFTGARKEGSQGRIRAAHGGTLFLYEIGDMPPSQQARLLRVLQEREVVPLGGGAPVRVDFQLICATHRNLREEMEAGRFRQDLYYRINGFALTLPPLRERSDLSALVCRLLDRFSPGRGISIEPSVASAFADYSWPGNIRQLANVLGTACVLLDPEEMEIGWKHLPDDLIFEMRSMPKPRPEGTVNLRELSDAALERAISESCGNLSEAARRLGISRNTLYRRMRSR
ncbi:MAG: sigma-54-dependent Fis family transcriptional regulator [Burkholderiales bacterium]|nr:sigma-54-dependent Fis family transcriptional regulator [Burkholderiales bacterium]